jgi:uncharacterized protein YqgV (UPF0045/DUF77 family)
MIANFRISATDSTSADRDVARFTDILEASGLPYRIGPLRTRVEGDWGKVMAVIRCCQQAAAERHGRVVTHIRLDECQCRPHHDCEMTRTAAERLDARVPHGDLDAVC